MTEQNFCNIMTALEERYRQAEDFYSSIENVFGGSPVDEIITHNYFNIALEAISAGFEKSILDDLEFFIYECDWNFYAYCGRVEITTVDENGELIKWHPDIGTYEEYYQYLVGGPERN